MQIETSRDEIEYLKEINLKLTMALSDVLDFTSHHPNPKYLNYIKLIKQSERGYK